MKPVSAEEMFSMLDMDGDNSMSREEFDMLFERLQLDVNDLAKDQMFAYCDADGSGEITQEEFVTAWAWMMERFTTDIAERYGLSNGRIAIAVFGAFLMIAAMIAFILIALRIWQNDDSFDSTIQSLLIGGAGVLQKKVESSPIGTMDEKELDKVVDSEINGQSSDAQSAAATSADDKKDQ